MYGGGFPVLGQDKNLDWFREEMKTRFEIEVKARLGPGPNDDHAVTILSRALTWGGPGDRV